MNGGEVGRKRDLQDFDTVSKLDEGATNFSNPAVGSIFFLGDGPFDQREYLI